ncbi:HPr kinase/phosphorylase [Roseospirillum parvum]|uniref:HPr Serine kinase C-terminal domain-containing protein n=1 Tax=Roseospirillum parvum TaxID=83401 RepID=A0A1G7ZZ46_9PROT|nr:hypothetical protein [Roseospirillum parvum]SDH13979.1 HPr Serine kinase C-terminal domain-containing protein [Roseospirillum parvum]
MPRVNATCIEIDGQGVLLAGPSGAGKSDLALRLVLDHGARLVADDWTEVVAENGRPVATPPAALAGLIEVRGLGVVALPAERLATGVPLHLWVDLVPPAAVERLPEPSARQVAGLSLPRLALAPFQASAPARLRLALGVAVGRLELAS